MRRAIDDARAANPMVRIAIAMAEFEPTSGIAETNSATDPARLTRTMQWGRRIVTNRGVPIITMGISTYNTGAGLLLGPSHQIGRPMVRLEMATARTDARTPIQVINETVRQPSLGDGVGRTDSLEVIMVTVHPLSWLHRHGGEGGVAISLSCDGKVHLFKVVRVLPDVE